MSKLAKLILSVSAVAFVAALVGVALYFWKNPVKGLNCEDEEALYL